MSESPRPPGFLQEADFSYSCMRLLCTAAMGAAILSGALTLLVPSAAASGVTITGMFLGAAIAGKVTQKAFESPGASP